MREVRFRFPLSRAALGLGAALALAVAGCGGGGHATKGTVVVSQTGAPDSLDPALSYTYNGWQPLWLVYTPLLTYRHAEGAAGTRLIPGLARALPAISDGGRRYRLRLRAGVRYSDGRPVRAGDFAHAIERVLHLQSPGSAFYLPIAGASRYAAGHAKAISGIAADDATGTITITLTHPDGTFEDALALPFAAPVPSDTPMRNLSAHPPVGAGPYRFASVRPRAGWVLERTPGFSLPGVPAARNRRVEARFSQSLERQAQDVLSGRLDSMLDPPPADLVRRAQATGRLRTGPGNRVVELFLDTRDAPFDDPALRRAAALAVDPAALARLYGPLMRTSCNALPPAAPGYRPLRPCPQRGPDPAANRARARRILRAAGGSPPITVWSPAEAPDAAAGDYVADALQRVGFRTRTRHVPLAVYVQTVGARSTHAQIGVIGLAQDIPHPASLLRYFSGRELTPTNNLNLSRVDDPSLTRRIEHLRTVTPLSRALSGWAAVDRTVVDRVYAIPYGASSATLLTSTHVGCGKLHPVFGPDLSSFCPRSG